MKYKIKVSWNWIYDGIEAESLGEAQKKAIQMGAERVDADNMTAEQYSEPINWWEQAEQEGQTIAEELVDKIGEAITKWKKENPKGGMYRLDDDIAGEIYDNLYQSEDISDLAWQSADGRFIYNSNDALKEAMDCISRLDEYASGDSGLWEGKTDYWDIINIQAMDAYKGAVMASSEEAIKERITELLAAKE